MKKATFAAGCFWGAEAAFENLRGIELTEVGYMGGKIENPTYEDVCTNKTGHAEVVQITYDPSKISYNKLLDVFFKIHDPTQLNRQGPDIGTQYRSAIFYHDDEQKNLAEEFKRELEKKNVSIVTEITSAKTFYKAEEYHQKYFKKQNIQRIN